MELSTIANIATALTVLIAVAFGLIEMPAIQLERHSPGDINLEKGAQEAYADWKP